MPSKTKKAVPRSLKAIAADMKRLIEEVKQSSWTSPKRKPAARQRSRPRAGVRARTGRR